MGLKGASEVEASLSGVGGASGVVRELNLLLKQRS
jgi:hypothetical protein